MSGRPVHLLAAVAIAATASAMTTSTASAGCFTGCGAYMHAAPVAYYSAPVVYGYSYAAPAAYAAPCSPCGGYGYGYVTPSYVVNQGPAYTEPVLGYADPTPAPSVGYRYGYGYRGAYPLYRDGGVRWHRRYWSYRGHRVHSYRHGYRAFGHHRYRYGAVAPSWRHAVRHLMVGPRGIHRPHHPMHGPGGMHRGPRHGVPGFVHPMRHATDAMPPRHGGPMHPMPKKRPMP